jgi:hypothetical protein
MMGAACAVRAVEPQPIDEYSLKAVFLYNFGKFVEWPQEAFASSTDPLRVCVLGEDPFGRALDDVLAGKTICGRRLVPLRVAQTSEAGNCQILFVSASAKKHNKAILATLRNRNVLTVGETDGFAEQGGVINLKLDKGSVHIEINKEAAALAKLRISAKLWNLARIVK